MTRKHAELWIQEAINAMVAFCKKDGQKKKVCVASSLQHLSEDCSPNDLDTSPEEQHVVDFLSDSSSWVSRKSIIESLKQNFPRMRSPLWRTEVFLNGHAKKSCGSPMDRMARQLA